MDLNELRSRIAGLEPKQEQLWSKMKHLEAEMEPYKVRYDNAAREWCDLYSKIKNLKLLLADEEAANLTAEPIVYNRGELAPRDCRTEHDKTL